VQVWLGVSPLSPSAGVGVRDPSAAWEFMNSASRSELSATAEEAVAKQA
jgi:hypothetical protein